MQRNMPASPPTQSLNPLDDATGVNAVDYSADFDGLYKRVDNLEKSFKTGSAPRKLIRYIPGLVKPTYQGQISGTQENRAYADDTYRDLKIAEFNIQLTANQYMNFHNVHLVFSLRIKKGTNNANNILATEIPVNNFFAHWIKEIDIKYYGDDLPILPLTNTVEVYKYSDAMLKHVPKEVLEVIRYDLMYSKKKLKLLDDEDQRDEHTAAGEDADNRTDDNIDDRIEKFQDQIKNTKYYRILLKYLCNIGLVDQPIRFNTKWRLTFETNMQKLFESKANQAEAAGLPNNVDAKIILDSAPYILYYQFDLNDNFRTYQEGAMISENSLRMGLQRTPLQKSYEMAVGSQWQTVTFNNVFKQFPFIEISLIYD